MKLIDKYFSKIDLNNIKNYGGYNWLNPFIKDVPLKNVKQLSFISLYPNIICGIIENGLHNSCKDSVKESLNNFKKTFEYFDKNKKDIKLDKNKYLEIKKSINSFYGQLGFLSKTDMAPNFPGLVTEYISYYYEDLLANNPGNILYIDTDIIFYAEEIDLLGFNVPYDIEDIDYIYFSGKKQYVSCKNEIIARGYHKNAQEAINLLKGYIRSDKIEKLGI